MSRPVDVVIHEARAFMAERITTNAGLRDHHSHGQDTQPPVQPDAVAFVETTEEASQLMVLCHGNGGLLGGGIASFAFIPQTINGLTLVNIDTDGDGGVDQSIQLIGDQTLLSVDDFLL